MPKPKTHANATAQMPLLRLLVRGLEIDAERGEGGVINLAVRAQQHHQGLLRRLRQHLANALFRAADLSNPGQHNGGVRVIHRVVRSTSVQHKATDSIEPQVFEVWPLHTADGDAHYQALVVHEGVERHHDGRLVAGKFLDHSRQRCAHDAHGFSPLSTSILKGKNIVAWPDGDHHHSRSTRTAS